MIGNSNKHGVFLLTDSFQKLLHRHISCLWKVPEEQTAKREGKRARSLIFWKVSILVICVWLLLCVKFLL